MSYAQVTCGPICLQYRLLTGDLVNQTTTTTWKIVWKLRHQLDNGTTTDAPHAETGYVDLNEDKVRDAVPRFNENTDGNGPCSAGVNDEHCDIDENNY